MCWRDRAMCVSQGLQRRHETHKLGVLLVMTDVFRIGEGRLCNLPYFQAWLLPTMCKRSGNSR